MNLLGLILYREPLITRSLSSRLTSRLFRDFVVKVTVLSLGIRRVLEEDGRNIRILSLVIRISSRDLMAVVGITGELLL
jgi:hypothetical protein